MSTTLSVTHPASTRGTPGATGGQHASDQGNLGLQLVAKVASAVVRRAMASSPDNQVLFMIVGLTSKITCAIARRIAQDFDNVTVGVHDDLADDTLDRSLISKRSLASYRNTVREVGVGGIVFAPSAKEVLIVGPTSGEIPRFSEHYLVTQTELWLECSGSFEHITERERGHILNIMRGISEAQILTTGLEMFGDFIARLDASYAATSDIEQAVDAALPALRIPFGQARFKKPAGKGRLASVQTWADRFRVLQTTCDDALNLRRDGAPLNRALLRLRLQELLNEQAITGDEEAVLGDLINDTRIVPGQWCASQARACTLRWSAIERLIKASKRKVQKSLGEATTTLFREKMPQVLNEDDKALLDAMLPDADSADDDERGFFFRHRSDIASEGTKAIFKRWEQFVFRKTEQHSDLALGLFIAIADLVEGTETQPSNPLVYVRLQGAERLKFWETHNLSICRFMRDRYRGLPGIFEGSGIELDWGMCWTGEWDVGVTPARTARTSREFKFDIFLLDAVGERPVAEVDRRVWLQELARKSLGTTQLLWNMPADSMASSYSDNMTEVAAKDEPIALLASGRFARAQDQDRSTDGMLSLERRSTFQDANGQLDGMLIDANDTVVRVGTAFEQGLANLRGGSLPEVDAKAIDAAYRAFVASYTEAVRAIMFRTGKGLEDPSLLLQSVAYGDLLNLLRNHARNDDCRRSLWVPMLSLGIACSQETPPVGICTPWHPFKLAAAAAKARQLASALASIVSGSAADVRTFSRNVARTVSDGWHPAVALYHPSTKPLLISEIDQFADFGLMEAPTTDQGAADSFDGFSDQAAKELLTVAEEYLDIQPHERSNFSVVLYNADNRGLPSKLASALAAKVEKEKDLRCDLILTHSNQARLRKIYSEQNVSISARLDEAMASEAAQTFLSRLRVGFIDLGGLGESDQDVQSADLVFLHDVIARAARTAWRRIPEPRNGWVPFEKGAPDGATRRRHFERGIRKTESLLVPPERPIEVQYYLDLLRDFHVDFRDLADGHYVPVREIDIDESGVSDILKQAHSVARWVVTYDAIADKNLFRNNDVGIIRYVPRPDHDHNLIVSTRQPGAMLLTKLSEEVGRILKVSKREARMVADTCIREASEISGRVVLRAARLENNALELLGLVLSRRVFVDSLDEESTVVCWLLLDDFADRLGHRGRKADILIVSLSMPDDVPTVDLTIIESKFTGTDGEKSAMEDSLDQMEASTNDLRDRIIGTADELNRPAWLRQIADLIIEQGTFPATVHGHDAEDWARIIRADEATLRISGLSMVFIHDRLEGSVEPFLCRSDEQQQYTFNRDEIADGLRCMQAAVGRQS